MSEKLDGKTERGVNTLVVCEKWPGRGTGRGNSTINLGKGGE